MTSLSGRTVVITRPADQAGETAELLRRSYELVFAKLTKKLQRELGAAQ